MCIYTHTHTHNTHTHTSTYASFCVRSSIQAYTSEHSRTKNYVTLFYVTYASFCVRSSISLKRSAMVCGMTPGLPVEPDMEKVLPEPVAPYAKTVPWIPSITCHLVVVVVRCMHTQSHKHTDINKQTQKAHTYIYLNTHKRWLMRRDWARPHLAHDALGRVLIQILLRGLGPQHDVELKLALPGALQREEGCV